MYSLRLTCSTGDVDRLSCQLWEAGTAGIRELDEGETVVLIAGFENNGQRPYLLNLFASYSPEWEQEEAIDWVAETQLAWPARPIGNRIFLTPTWSNEAIPAGRVRVIHNPGLACGTGEHPCTQMALTALEECITTGCSLIDVGTGSGILPITALRLGAESAIGIDTDAAALSAARENFELNGLEPMLVAGSADCIRGECADVTVANISGTVLLSIMDELRRITRHHGWLILTGFPEWELPVFQREFPSSTISGTNEWRCLVVKNSS